MCFLKGIIGKTNLLISSEEVEMMRIKTKKKGRKRHEKQQKNE